MLDLNDANVSSQNAGVADENIVKELDSNKTLEEISDTIDSKTIAEDENTPSSQRQQNSYFEKETESFEIIKNICQSFNSFQKTIVDTDKAPFLDAAYKHASIIERSRTSCTSGNLSTTTKPTIHVITKANERDDYIYKKAGFRKDASSDYISVIERSPTSYTSGNLLTNTLEPRSHPLAETSERDVKETGIVPTSASPTTESSTSESSIIPKGENLPPISYTQFHKRKIHCNVSKDDDWDINQSGFATFIPKCENIPPTSNARLHKREIPCDVFKEDDDWDIYQPGFVTTDITESLQESVFSFERLKTSTERNEERILKEVREFFLENPVEVTCNLDNVDRKAWIITSPYFSMDFALKHGLPRPTFKLIPELNLPKDQVTVRRLFVGYELMIDSGISEDDFFRYMSAKNQKLADTNPLLWYDYSELDPLMEQLDHIQEQVGLDIFDLIYEQLRTDEKYQALFRNKDLLINTVLFWYSYNDERRKLLREQFIKNRYISLSRNPANYTSHALSEDALVTRTNEIQSITGQSSVIDIPDLNDPDTNSHTRDETSEEISVSRANEDFQSSISRSHVLKIPDLKDPDTNSSADDGGMKGLNKILKNSQSSTDLSKVQSLKPNDILETELKSSPMMQPINEDNRENKRSFDSLQDHSDKLNDCLYPDTIMPLYIQNSDEEKPRQMHLVTSQNSPNYTTHSSDQNLKEKSEIESEMSYDILEYISCVRSGVRKCIPHDDDDNSRKKIRLKENSNIGQS